MIVAVLLAGVPASTAFAQREFRQPRLVVVLVVDQMRADYLTRFSDQLGNNGFRRLMSNGAHFVNASYSFGATSTAAGHSTIITGRLPRQHGVVADQWVQGQADPTMRAAFFDPDAKMLVGPGGRKEGRSPRNLIGAALGDQLKLANRASRVFSVSLQDGAAIPLGGKRPDGAFWWDLNTGHFVTSDYYMNELPVYVREFNSQRWADRFVNGRWDRVLPPAAYEVMQPLNPEWLTQTEGLGPAFPHVIPRVAGAPSRDYYVAVSSTPFGNEVVLEMARRILAGERLGLGTATDLLCVSLSSFEAAGRLFGPDSPEMMDFTVRTDRQIGTFLDLIDRAVGLTRCVVVLTSDHGVTAASRVAAAAGLPAGRIDVAGVVKSLNARLAGVAALPNNHEHIVATQMPWLFMDPAVSSLAPEARTQVFATAKRSLEALDGVADVFTVSDLEGPAPAASEVARYPAWRSYFPGRAGELYVRLTPFWNTREGGFAESIAGSNHDRHVPIIMMGGLARPGRYFTQADPADIPTTLAAMLGIEPPLGAVGRVLHEAFDPAEFAR